MQALLGINAASEVRPIPGTSPEKLAARRAQSAAYAAKLQTGGFNEALTRAVLYVIAADRTLDQRCALALNVARQQLMHLSLAKFKAVVRDQFFVLQLDGERAVEVLASMVPEADARKALLQQVHAIVGAGAAPTVAERGRLTRLSQVLSMPPAKPADVLLRPAGKGPPPRHSPSVGPAAVPRLAATVGGITMPSVQNKTFDEIRLGDTASVQRTLQARDVRAWAAAFGDVGLLADAGDTQGAAGIVTALLSSLVGSHCLAPDRRSARPRCRYWLRCPSMPS